jgi:hypothetical protein
MDVQTAATLADLRQQLDAARRDNDFLRGFANNPDVQALRDDLDAARDDAAMWQKAHAEQGVALTEARADVVRLTAQLDASRQACNDTDLELAKAMSRADVLEAEVRAWHAWDDKHFDELATDEDTRRAEEYLDACIVRTVDTNAIDPAKFEVQP